MATLMLVITRLIPTLAYLGIAALLFFQAQGWDTQQRSLVTHLPYILCGLAILMALLSNHVRELTLAITVLITYWLIRSFLQASLTSQPAGQVFSLLSIGFPLAIIAISLLPETGWRHPAGILKTFTAPLLVLLCVALFQLSPDWFTAASDAMMADAFYFLKISTLSHTLFITAAVGALVLLLWRGGNTESSLLGCSLLCCATLGWFQLPAISATLFSCCGLLLVVNQVRDLLNLSYRDELTQIANRRALHSAARSLGNNYSLAMVDIDHFKKINDNYGHDVGDQVLRIVAGKLKSVGSGGRVYRYGGEEFCILFRGKNVEEITPELEELRKMIAEYDMVMRNKHTRPGKATKGVKKRGATRRKSDLRITVSMGLADSQTADGLFKSVMKVADNALYGAKRSGRNRIQVA